MIDLNTIKESYPFPCYFFLVSSASLQCLKLHKIGYMLLMNINSKASVINSGVDATGEAKTEETQKYNSPMESSETLEWIKHRKY